MSWLAMTPGKRLPMPLTRTASPDCTSVVKMSPPDGFVRRRRTSPEPRYRAAPGSVVKPGRSALGDGRDLDLAALDLLGVAVDLTGDVVDEATRLGVADAVDLEVVGLVAGRELVVRDLLDHVEDRDVDALEHRGEDVLLLVRVSGEVLVGVDADRPEAVA